MALVWLGIAYTVVGIICVTILGKVWDAVLGKIGDTVLGKIGDYVAAPIQRQFSYMCCFNSNIKKLETQLQELEKTRQGVQLGVDDDLKKARVTGSNVKEWSKKVDEVTSEVDGIIQDKAKVKEGCLNGWSNLKLRYSLSRKAVKKSEAVVKLQAAGILYMETIPNRDFMGFESRRLTVEEIIMALKHDGIKLIGICGMGGIGKTTMTKEVAKRVKEDSLFDKVAMAIVSQEPSPTNIQACIADMLDLKLVDRHSPIVRANLLRRRLLEDNKKILIILDDVWAEFNLEDMGIPLGGPNKNLKMLYTSRIQALWHDSQIKEEIALELLSEDESWQLFREKTGDLADARDLQPIAKQIVNECGQLPLALVIIGSALSKKSKGNFIKDIWEDMLDQLTCARNTPPGNSLSSSLELSYKYVEDEEAKRLFLLCCLFEEDEDIRIEDLARYGYGLSLFDGINELGKVRRRVVVIVDDLKSRYLLLDSEKNECVKVHDAVRDMGICIASKVECALVRHGAVTEWPKTVTHEHYTAISVISEKIKELPDGLKYANLEFLMLRCNELEKIPPNFLKGMGKVKVLELKNFHGILTFQPLKNLTTLALEGFCGMLDYIHVIGDLLTLEILSFRNSEIEELPEEIGKLVKLRLLDLCGTTSLERIPPGVISRLVRLEELYVIPSSFVDWEGEGHGKGQNANLKEFESLSFLNTLEIIIKKHVVVPKLPILGELKKYKVIQEDLYEAFRYGMHNPCERYFMINEWNWDTPAGHGGIDTLLRSSDYLYLTKGSNDLVQLLLLDGVDSLQQLKYLQINSCDSPECVANTMNPVQQPPDATVVFPILEKLVLFLVHNLREICYGPVAAGSFGQLTEIEIRECGGLENLFPQPIVGCLTQLKTLTIVECDKMEEVIWKEQREDVHVAPNRIEFPKLEYLYLAHLPSLIGFCRGIEQIDFPELQEQQLHDLRKVNHLFHSNNNLSSNSEQNGKIVSFLSLFPEKVSLPNLEILRVSKLENLERLGHGLLSLSKLKDILVRCCSKLFYVFPSPLLLMLRDLEELYVKGCNLLEVVFELEGVDSKEPNPEIFPPLKVLQLRYLPQLNYISKRDPMVFKYIQTLKIYACDSLRYVFAPTMTKSIPQLRDLKIQRCEMLSSIVAEKNGLGESSVDEVEFPKLESLDLRELPNLVSFFRNVNATPAKSIDQLHNTMQTLPLFNKKVAFPGLENLYLKGLPNMKDLWCTKLPTSSFSKLYKLEVSDCASLRNMFHPSMAGGLVNLKELLIEDCLTLEAVVGKEDEVEGGHGRKIDKTLFPQLRKLQLDSLPNLRRFCNTTHPLELPRVSEMDISFCHSMDAFSLGHVSAPNLSLPGISWNGDLNNAIRLLQKVAPSLILVKVLKPNYSNRDDPMARRKLRTLDDFTDTSKPWQVAETQCQLVAIPDRIYGANKVVRLLYTKSGNGVLALGCNGIMRLWKWADNLHNQSEMATYSVVPQQWQPVGGLVMMNDVTGVNIEKVVPCIALSKEDSHVISACGGVISVFNMMTFKVVTTCMPPPPASTFLALYPEDNNVIAIGMEDSTIRIYNVEVNEVKSILKGHQKRITSLAFSTKLKILVSSGADAQLCIWSTDTWERLKSVPIQPPARKACNSDTRVEFHYGLIRLLVSHETQLAIYHDASKMNSSRQWVPQDVLPAPISCAAYSCDSQLVYTSFCDGNIGVFDANTLTLQSRIAPSAYLSPPLLSRSHAVYPQLVLAAHPRDPYQFAVGLSDGFVKVMEPPESEGNRGLSPPIDNGMLNGRTASSSNTSNHIPNQKGEDVDVDEDLDKDVDEDALITTRKRKRTATTVTHDDE